MIRIALAAALLAATLTQAMARDVLEPRLRELVTVTADVVLIGDLVEDAGAAANIAVFRAPDLGETGAVDVARVMAALQPHHISNLDTGGLREVVVTRLSRVIPAAELEARIIRAFAGQHGFGDVRNLTIVTDRPLRTLHVETSATADLSVARVNVDARSGRFDVTFELPGSAAARRLPLRITGTVSETVETVLLTNAVARGDTVKASDIVVERKRKSELFSGAIPADQAIGLAAKRQMRAGEVLRAADLMKPEAVKRNQTVTIVYQIPGITLTVRGKALESGAVGDLINVTNIQSNRTVQATIEGPGTVSIAAPVTPVAVAPAPVAVSPPNPAPVAAPAAIPVAPAMPAAPAPVVPAEPIAAPSVAPFAAPSAIVFAPPTPYMPAVAPATSVPVAEAELPPTP